MTLSSVAMDQGESDREHDTTLLAKALYDNLADAPDELSFRKGDIVTVIEQDVDGLVGWWLCILHGRQGIAPGNRLQLLPNYEAQKNAKRPIRRGSYSTDDFSDSQDGSWVSDASSSQQLDYDTLPPQRGLGPRSDKLSVKDLYDIPLGHGGDTLRRGLTLLQSEGLETYDLPTTLPRGSHVQRKSSRQQPVSPQDELYDHPPKASEPASPRYSKPRPVEPQEIYDAPRSTRRESQELYDVPNSHPAVHQGTTSSDAERQMLYDVPHQSSGPHRGRSYNVATSSPPLTPKQLRAADLFQIPAPNAVGMGKSAPVNYDTPRKISQYDTPKMYSDTPELYDVPPRNVKHEVQEVYDVPTKTPERGAGSGSATLPARTSQDYLRDAEPTELYDVPTRNAPGQVLPDSVNSKNNYNAQLSRDGKGLPIYNTPRKQEGPILSKSLPATSYIPSVPLNNNTEIYDSPKSQGNLGPGHDPTEIYDVPSRKTSGIEEMYDVPPSLSQREGPTEIYDIPPRQGDPRMMSPATSCGYEQDVYDTPPTHDVNKVMAAIGINEARKRLVKAANYNNSDDDDYVDYEDIYGREPPSYIVKDMNKQQATTSPPTTRPPGPKRQQSVLEQINMDAVKELSITSNQAVDRLAKLHLAVDTSVTTLLGFAEGDWLNPGKLKTTINAIRDMAGKVKIALRLLTEFGLGTLVNAKKLPYGGNLVNNINSNVEPLVESYYKIKVCLLHLESNDWTVPDARDSDTEKFFATVNAIMILSERIPEHCRRMNTVIQGNLQPLFGQGNTGMSPTAEVVPEHKPPATSPTGVRHDLKGKLKQIGPIDAKTVRGILDIDQRMSCQANAGMFDQRRVPVVPDNNSGTLRRRQEVMTTTLPRPPVPPKPALPNNRRSLAIVPPDTVWMKGPVPSRVETLVTEYAVESPRIKYNSDPTRSPSELEKNKDPAWGGSCPSLQGNTVVTERGLLHTASTEESMPNSVSQGDVGISTEKLQSVSLGRKLPSESNIHDAELAVNATLHSRSASVPYDEKDAKFPTYELEAPRSPQRSSSGVAKLDHRDIETLEFFLRQVEAQVMILRGAMKNLTESVEKNSVPQVFVAHSKFVILTAHKVVHAAEEVTERLMDQDVTQRIRRENVHLTDNIRAVVAATKTAALDYPNNNSMVEMISTVLSLGESVRDIHGEAKRALSL